MDMLELITQWKNGNKAARDKLVEENVRLVWSIVRRFASRGYDLEDLFQIGSIGLIKAIDKFDLTYDVKFSTYAVPMITGEIKRYLRDDGMIKVSRTYKEIAYKIKVAKEQLTLKQGREPTLDELSEYTGISKDEIIIAQEAVSEVDSIYKTVHQNDGKSVFLIDKIEEKNDEHGKLINRITLKKIIDELEEKERNIIRFRYFEEKTQMEVANILGISQVQVSRLEKKILLKMKEKLT